MIQFRNDTDALQKFIAVRHWFEKEITSEINLEKP